MSKYQVLSPIKTVEGVVVEGYVEIADAEVAELSRLGVIGEAEPVAAAPSVDRAALSADRQAEIKAAIAQLSTADASLWLADGRPNAAAISALTGWNVSAAERDAAWSSLSPQS